MAEEGRQAIRQLDGWTVYVVTQGTWTGYFTTERADETNPLNADSLPMKETLAEAVAQIEKMKKTKREQLEVPVTRVQMDYSGELRFDTLVLKGIHASRTQLRYTGSTGDHGSHEGHYLFLPNDPMLKTLRELTEEAKRLNEKRTALTEQAKRLLQNEGIGVRKFLEGGTDNVAEREAKLKETLQARAKKLEVPEEVGPCEKQA